VPAFPEAFGADRLADNVLELLEHRESTAVPRWVAAHFAECWGATKTRILRVYPVAAARERGTSSTGYAVSSDTLDFDDLPSPIDADPALLAAIEGLQVTDEQTTEGGWRVLIPLASGGEVRYVVELAMTDAARAEPPSQSRLLPIVGCFFDLLAGAETDPLTGLANRRLFYSQIGAGLARWAAGPAVRFLAVMDIDNFKQVNDRFGHLYGDEILIHFARLMRATFRAGDMLYRFGGEEFVVVFAVKRVEDGNAALERFRHAVEAYDFPRTGKITVSIGFTGIQGNGGPVTTLIDRADNAVYYAKRNGRNQVCGYEALVEKGDLAPSKAAQGGEATLF
jgi:diguanylate cyclase (GGDEF)-like protein